MRERRLISLRIPFLPIRFSVSGHADAIEAFVDTGFDGDLSVPQRYVSVLGAAVFKIEWQLADGSHVDSPVYDGMVQVGDFVAVPAHIGVLGDEPIVGRGILDRFSVTFDHGRRLIVEL